MHDIVLYVSRMMAQLATVSSKNSTRWPSVRDTPLQEDKGFGVLSEVCGGIVCGKDLIVTAPPSFANLNEPMKTSSVVDKRESIDPLRRRAVAQDADAAARASSKSSLLQDMREEKSV